MKLYLDTSDLVKMYVDQPRSEEVRSLTDNASALATASITYAETRAALARLRRESVLSASRFAAIKRQLEEDWRHVVSVHMNGDLVREAGEFAERYRLRGMDSLHLAAYAEFRRTNAPDEVRFCSSDTELDKAARAVASRLAGKQPAWKEGATDDDAR
jgi:predicted nucleic acid-binding protein